MIARATHFSKEMHTNVRPLRMLCYMLRTLAFCIALWETGCNIARYILCRILSAYGMTISSTQHCSIVIPPSSIGEFSFHPSCDEALLTRVYARVVLHLGSSSRWCLAQEKTRQNNEHTTTMRSRSTTPSPSTRASTEPRGRTRSGRCFASGGPAPAELS